mmetsp:Transcript_29453/g.88085  ORF Transcript_29453/g.88085 Transcript_29453/m.88085 type:complete len:103 (-) Transcript_29453:81-389(-)
MKHIVALALLAARAASQDTAAAPKQRRLRFGTYKDEAPPVVAITESPSAEPAVAPTAEPSLAPTAQCKQSGEPCIYGQDTCCNALEVCGGLVTGCFDPVVLL